MSTEKIKKSFFELVAETPSTETIEVFLTRFPEIGWKIRAISTEELKQLRQKHAQLADQIAFSEGVVITCVINPDDGQPLFRNAAEMQKMKCTTPAQLLTRILRVGEIECLSGLILKFSGFESISEMQDKVKSF